MNKCICPNCKIEMDKKKTLEGDMILCGICSFGWFIEKVVTSNYEKIAY